MKRTFPRTALAAALLFGLSQGAYATGINTPSSINLPIGAGGPTVITVTTPTPPAGVMPSAVGIGTTTPITTLDVNGDARLGPQHLILGPDTNRTGDSGLRLSNYTNDPSYPDTTLALMPSGVAGASAWFRIYNADDPTGTNLGMVDIGFHDPSTLQFGLGRFGTGTAPTTFAFTGGNIGVDTFTPQAKLDVNGNVNVTGNANISGSVKLGDDMSSCTSSNAGAIRWNGTAFEGCNGTAWASLIAKPQVNYYRANLPYGAVTHYVDCGAGEVEVSCNSIEVPSGQFVCDTAPGVDPDTGNNACAQDGCGQGVRTDTGYLTTVTCMKY